MGGCAGKLKDSDIHQEPLPAEGFASHKKVAEGEIVAQVCIAFMSFIVEKYWLFEIMLHCLFLLLICDCRMATMEVRYRLKRPSLR